MAQRLGELRARVSGGEPIGTGRAVRCQRSLEALPPNHVEHRRPISANEQRAQGSGSGARRGHKKQRLALDRAPLAYALDCGDSGHMRLSLARAKQQRTENRDENLYGGPSVAALPRADFMRRCARQAWCPAA